MGGCFIGLDIKGLQKVGRVNFKKDATSYFWDMSFFFYLILQFFFTLTKFRQTQSFTSVIDVSQYPFKLRTRNSLRGFARPSKKI